MNKLKALCNIPPIEIRLIQALLLSEFNNTVLALDLHIIMWVSPYLQVEIMFFVKKGWIRYCSVVNGRAH